MKVFDSADIARQYKITKTAADMYTQLKRISWVSSQNGDRYRDRDGFYCYVSRMKLAEMIGRSEATAARCTRQLVSVGLIRVKRTKHIHKIYVLDVVMPGKNDTTRQVKNDTSISKYKSEYNNNGSINPVKMSAGHETSDLISSAVERCHAYAADRPAAENKNSQVEPAVTPQPTRQRTQKPRNRITKQVKQKAREQYYTMMADRLGLSNSDWCMFQDEHARMKALVSIVADALSVPSRQFRINGRNVTTSEYWRVVQSMTLESMASIPDRVEEYRLSSNGIRNLNSYVLACVFNECQYQNLIKGASPSIA